MHLSPGLVRPSGVRREIHCRRTTVFPLSRRHRIQFLQPSDWFLRRRVTIDGDYGYSNPSLVRIDGEIHLAMVAASNNWQTGRNPQFDKGGMLLVDGMIIAVDGKDGKLYLLEATPEKFKVRSQAQMLIPSSCWAPLALSRGKLIIRDMLNMKCLLVK